MRETDLARELLSSADKDLRAIKHMADPNIFADEVFGFHAQQAVEKTLKAWIALLGQEYPTRLATETANLVSYSTS